MKTCFVIIGYGEKRDPVSNKTVNLDKTFKNIIKPVFEEAGYSCNRSIDLNSSGIITEDMFKHILYSDFVVADITTFNPNVMYELGVRHALKPYSTIIICDADSLKKIPFNIKDLVIHPYHHLGSGIDFEEVEKQRTNMTKLIEKLEKENKVDSPIHTFIKDITVTYNQPVEKGLNFKTRSGNEETFGELMDRAEQAKNAKNFIEAKKLFQQLNQYRPSDEFIIKRLALVTYKSKTPDEETSLHDALAILNQLNPVSQTDPESSGLMGSINKRLYMMTDNEQYLDRSIHYYRKGYLINDDYYTGVNYAVMNDMKAKLSEDEGEAKVIGMESNLTRKNVLKLLETKIDETTDKEEKGWQMLTKAELEFDLGNDSMTQEILKNPAAFELTAFQLDSFKDQYENKLKDNK